MRRIWHAIRIFFLTVFDRHVAREINALLQRRGLPIPSPPEGKTEAPAPRAVERSTPVRSDALTLLATLQREARLVDFLKEPLTGYSDTQIGAAARDVHRDCGQVLDRVFALVPLGTEEEGTELEIPAGFDAHRFRLTGNVVGEPPFRGHVVHHGWEATQCALPAWSGPAEAACVVAPIEVELK